VKVGDLVTYYDGLNSDNRPGIITKIDHWVDKSAPDRNFGTDVWVLFQDGDHRAFDPNELDLVDENRNIS